MGTVADATFLAWNAGEWEAIWVGVGVIVALALGGYQVHESRQVRHDTSRPFIIVDFHFRSIMITLSVRNSGPTAATDVRVILDSPLSSAVMPHVDWQYSGLFKEGVPLFAPGREMRFALDTFPPRVEKNLPMSISGTVRYGLAQRQGLEIVEPFLIDMSGFSLALLPPKDIADLADEVEKIRKHLTE